MKIYKILFIIMMFILVETVYAMDFNITIDESQLPYNQTFYFNFTNIYLPFNITNTTNMSSINYTDMINVTFGAFIVSNTNYTFNDTNQTLTTTSNIFLPFGKPAGNYTTFIKFDYYNFSEQENFFIQITNATINFTPIPKFIMIDTNKFQIPICDYLLPYNTSLNDISITGSPNQTVDVVYDNNIFIGLNKQFNLSSAGLYVFNISVMIPNITTAGTYNYPILFNLSNSSVTLTVSIKVLDCIAPPMDIDKALEDCKKNVNVVDQMQCMINVQKAYLDSIQKSFAETVNNKTVNNTVVRYVNFTERVPVLDLQDPALLQSIRELPNLVATINAQQALIDSKFNNMFTSIDSKLNVIVNDNNALRTQNFQYRESLMNNLSYYERNYVKKTYIYIPIFLLCIAGAIGFVIYRYNENTIIA